MILTIPVLNKPSKFEVFFLLKTQLPGRRTPILQVKLKRKSMAESSPSPSPSSSTVLSTVAAMSDNDIEEMLERMLTNLAFCDDSKLESLLARLLPRALASLSSPSTAIRNKVLQLHTLFVLNC